MTTRSPALRAGALAWSAIAVLAAACHQAPQPPASTARVAADAALAAQPYTGPEPAARKPVHPGTRRADVGRWRVSADARDIADWVVDSGDNQDLPFIIVDKPKARVLAFDANGHLLGTAPALLGLAHGDDSVPGIGERKMADIKPEERTTPAGRFVAEMGRNANGEDILWVDYDAAVSMHRVRATVSAERRLQRLASPTPKDNRISYGCINLPAAFYDQIVRPLFAAKNGIVYVLPETRPARQVFGAYEVVRTAAGH